MRSRLGNVSLPMAAAITNLCITQVPMRKTLNIGVRTVRVNARTPAYAAVGFV